jgi:hypothetical protein
MEFGEVYYNLFLCIRVDPSMSLEDRNALLHYPSIWVIDDLVVFSSGIRSIRNF